MVLSVCAEVFWRILLEMGNFAIENWFLVLLVFFITSIITKKMGPLILGIIASALNISLDTILGATFGTTVLISGLGSIIIGIFWASIIFFSSSNPIIKTLNIPLMFVIGFVWGLLPIPIPIALVIGFLTRFRITNYMISVFPIVLTIGFLWLAGPTICSTLNSVIIFFS